MSLGRDHLSEPEPDKMTFKDCLLNGVWVTKEGKQITVKDMSFEHLENTMHLLMKRKKALLSSGDLEDKTEQKLAATDMWLNMIREEWKQRIIEGKDE